MKLDALIAQLGDVVQPNDDYSVVFESTTYAGYNEITEVEIDHANKVVVLKTTPQQ